LTTIASGVFPRDAREPQQTYICLIGGSTLVGTTGDVELVGVARAAAITA